MDQKAKEIYQSITAPPSLKERALGQQNASAENKPRKNFAAPLWKVLAPVAACAAVAVLAITGSLQGGQGPATVLLDGQKVESQPVQIAAEAAAEPRVAVATFNLNEEESFLIPLEIQTEEETTVRVSVGKLVTEQGDEAESIVLSEGSTALKWAIDGLTTKDSAELSVSCDEEQNFRLQYDDNGGCWTLSKDEE